MFLFQSKDADTRDLELWVSFRRGPFQKAQIPGNLKHQVYVCFYLLGFFSRVYIDFPLCNEYR